MVEQNDWKKRYENTSWNALQYFPSWLLGNSRVQFDHFAETVAERKSCACERTSDIEQAIRIFDENFTKY